VSDPAGEPQRLHPATLIARWLRIVPQMVIGGVGIAASAAERGLDRFMLFAGVAMGIGALFVVLAWWRFTFTVGDGEVVIEKGIVQRQRRVIPFDRIQDIAIEQRLLARLFGTAKVRLETGGSAADEGNLDMIALDEAEALRDRIRRGRAAAPCAGEDAAAAAPAGEPVLFAMELPRVLVAGLFNFSLVFLAAIGAVIQYLDQWGLIDWSDWITSRRADQAAHLVTIRTVAAFLFIVLVLGMVAGVVRMVMTNFGYRLTRAEAGLRRRRGLLTLTDVVIPLRRTQVALIESGPVGRLFGWYALSFQTLGADRKDGGVQAAAPFARMGELLPILAEAGFPVPPARADFHGPPRRALLRQAAPWLLLVLLAGGIAMWIEPWAGIAAAALLVVFLFAVLRWRRHAHALDGRALFVSHGFFRRRLWILPFGKTQTIRLSRGPVQRGLRLASLLVDTPGAPAMHNQAIVDLDAGEAETLAGRLLAQFYRARAATRLQPG
jgi:putative membrane protein